MTQSRETYDNQGNVILSEQIEADEAAIAKATIIALEDEITPRRLREAVLSAKGKTWLVNKDAEITALR